MGLFTKDLEVGQFWQWRCEDPFSDYCVDEILEIKDGYVKYRNWLIDTNGFAHDCLWRSNRKRDFVINCKLNKNIKEIKDGEKIKFYNREMA